MPVVTSIAVRKGGTADLLRLTDETRWRRPRPSRAKISGSRSRSSRIARDPARGRPHHRRDRQPAGAARHLDRADRRRGAASGRRAGDPGADPVRDVPGGVRLGAAADGAAVVGLRRARSTGARHPARGPAAKLPAERRDLRRRQRHRVPAADHHHLPVHPAAGRFRLHGARGVPDGPHHGRRRPARPRLHSAAVELRLRHPRHHGDTRDRQPPRPADHDPDRAADDLLGAHSGLHADHLGLHSGRSRSGAGSICRGS